jgi:choline-sulfatase
VVLAALGTGCSRSAEAPTRAAAPEPLPAILLVTLDTTRADAIEPETDAVATPHLAALAARGVRFLHAYATAPMTLPSHASMLTGLYPADHGVHDNGRFLSQELPLLPELLRERGYATAAFVSSFPLGRQFGLARGFDHYDDEVSADAPYRRAEATTDRALTHLERHGDALLFLWAHYFDPHDPYEPPEPYRSQYPDDPYLGEIAYMDAELGRLLAAFEARFRERGAKILVTADHGEGLGDHGETFHGDLLYQGVMRVPLLVVGPGIEPAVRPEPVSVRQVFDTVLSWAGAVPLRPGHLLTEAAEPVLGEAMKPFLNYGWQPQVMAVHDRLKVIRSGGVEVYDVVADPGETRNLAGEVALPRELRQAIRDYPLPGARAAEAGREGLTREAEERLASLGYLGWEGRQTLRPDAPSPKDMTHLFADLDRASGLFVREEYAAALPVLQRVLREDPHNLMVVVRLAVCHSLLDQPRHALELFDRAEAIDPGSSDVRHYRAMHHFRRGEDAEAGRLLETVVEAMPERLQSLAALSRIRERQGRVAEAADLLDQVVARRGGTGAELARLGELRMTTGDTPRALAAFEEARRLQGAEYRHHLELGVLYLAARRFEEARESLDRVPDGHPERPMALFKRAQVSVLLGEPDREERVRAAYREADATTRELIARETLFQGISY